MNISSRKDIVIFGAGSLGRRAKEALTATGYRVVFFVDNDKRKQRKKIDGIPVFPPSILKEKRRNFDLIIIASLPGMFEIENQLEGMGFLLYKDFVFFNVNSIIPPLKEKLEIPVKDFKNVIIKLDGIGDLAFVLPFLEDLLKVIGSETLFIASSTWAELVRFLFPKLYVFPVNLKTFTASKYYRESILSALKEKHWECAVILRFENLTAKDKSFLEALKSKRIFLPVVKNPPRNGFNHLLDNIAEFFSKEFGKTSDALSKTVKFYKKTCELIKKKIPLKLDNQPFATIVPLTGDPIRNLPVILTEKIVEKLIESKIGRIFFIGDGHYGFNFPSNYLVNLIGKLSLLEALRLIVDSSLVIGAETGLSHLSFLMGIPTLEIVGGGHFGRFVPFDEFKNLKLAYKKMSCFFCSWNCEKVRPGLIPPCITGISYDIIEEKIEELLMSYGTR